MSSIDFSRLPMSRKDFIAHFNVKIANTKWLGNLFEYSYSGKNEREETPVTPEKVEPIEEPFTSFPYVLDVKKSRVKITSLNPIEEAHTEFDPKKASFLFSIPYHNPTLEAVRRIVSAIEDQSYGTTAAESHSLVKKTVAVVIGLNNCRSFNPERNDAFKREIQKLRKTSLATHVSLTVLPFFWEHSWVPSRGQALVWRRIFSIFACYRIANSYFRYFRGSSDPLWISDWFNRKGNPSDQMVPYQIIRNTILHSTALKNYYNSCRSPLRYVLSVDGDFSSLKSASSNLGLLTHYTALARKHFAETQFFPDVMSTGYEPPSSEKNNLIKWGIKLDRAIRAAIPGIFVYMPEPNFAFRVRDVKDLALLSWIGGSSMDTESRRFIVNGLARKLLRSDRFVFSNSGAIQTEIDATWRTKSVNKYAGLQPAQLKLKEVQRTIRGLHQSYADPQIWATNVYAGLQVTVAAYMKECITPIKGIRELFDVITMRKERYGADQMVASDFATLFKVFPLYLQLMKDSGTSVEEFDEQAKEFVEKAQISGKRNREGWQDFMERQINKLHAYRGVLEKNYTLAQVDQVIQAAIETGKAITSFYARAFAAKT